MMHLSSPLILDNDRREDQISQKREEGKKWHARCASAGVSAAFKLELKDQQRKRRRRQHHL